MLPRGQNPAGQTARRAGRADRTRLVWQALRLHAAVRGAGAGLDPADDPGLRRGRLFAAVARLVNESWHRVHAICSRYVDLAVAQADLSAVSAVGDRRDLLPPWPRLP